MASDPFAGMAWMHMQIVAGLRRLGHDAIYCETTSAWPYDPLRAYKVCDSSYALPYLARVVSSFGLGDHWAYRRSYLDNAWFGPRAAAAQDLLQHADLVFNVAGATRFNDDGIRVGRPVYLGTDPVIHEAGYANGDEESLIIAREHPEAVTYGENIGRADCPIPPLPGLRANTRQPILIDHWEGTQASRRTFTTVGNWEQSGRDVVLNGVLYRWSKHHEMTRFLELPQRIGTPIEMATNLGAQLPGREDDQKVKARGFDPQVRARFEAHGWQFTDAVDLSLDHLRYRDYLRASRGEFTVARDLNVRTRSGWFSERSACYLAAGRPVITQNTGFGTVLPTGEGLFAIDTLDEAVAAFEAIESDYARHSRAAHAIASEYFSAERVLAQLLGALGA